MVNGILVGICVCVLIWACYTDHWIGNIAAIVLAIVGMTSCFNSEWYKESERVRQAEEARSAQPHVIREYDGCKVYAFKTDRVHYYTRCQNSTSTDTNYKVSCGKSCSKEETETIITENAK